MGDAVENEGFEPLCGDADLYHEMFNAAPEKPHIQVNQTPDAVDVEYDRNYYRIERNADGCTEGREAFRILRR
jgi:hypothetical protein